MTKLFAWLGVAMLAVLCGSTPALAGDPLKPYVVLILDTSGSMVGTSFGNPTGSGPPSCGGIDSKLNHAKCAINRISNSYGDMVFGLGRFRSTLGGTTTTNTFPTGCCEAGPNIGANGGCAAGPTCTNEDHMLQLLSPLIDGENQAASVFVNGTANSCTAGGTDPEIWDVAGGCGGVACGGATPLEGVLRGAKRYFSGLQATNTTTIWPAGGAATGFDPIRNDPTKTSFINPIGETTCNPNGATCSVAANCGATNNCCCVEQCRPYIVILLTDGDETCSGNPSNGATSLLTTDVDNRRYRIETKPIGFGISPGDSGIEAIAHAGGEPDGPGNEGFYASDEASLQLAISSILDDAIKTELCNNADDDCDSAIDEDFPGKGTTCTNGKNGVCRVNGDQQCRLDGTSLQCTAGLAACSGVPQGGACSVVNATGSTVAGTCQAGVCDPTPGTEVCNNLDDDCDGKIDEGVVGCTCSPQGEQCNNADDDCDTKIDEGIVKPCGVGTCQGTQTCAAGSFGQCLDGSGQPVQTPSTEICNGLDDNCDGIRDGLQAACSTMPPLPPNNFPVDDPRNNPGHPSNNPIPENICQPGLKTCPIVSMPPNSFLACQGEIKPCNGATPCPDLCDGRDEDCDNLIDEDFVPADCSSNCGVGTTTCVNGVITCNSVPVGTDDTCNNIDDDCDNNIDEGWVSPGMCGAGVVCSGLVECQMGVEVCVGDPIGQESCNCDDDDCDTKVDEGSLCGAGASCTHCQCALPCAQDEFPCPMGKFCKDDFCLADPCFQVTCPDVGGAKQVCQQNMAANDYTCVTACSLATCAATEVCIPATGECRPDNCSTFPDYCTADQLCIAGECKTNLCMNVTCGAGEYCVGGQCYGSCSGVDCPDGKRCRMGVCENDPCGHPCPFGQVCKESEGQCLTDECQFIPCLEGQWCNPQTVACEDDPCNGTTCPNPGEVCKGGTCFDAQDLLPDAASEQHVTTGGGGGCSTGGGGGMLLALGIALTAIRRRRGGRA